MATKTKEKCVTLLSLEPGQHFKAPEDPGFRTKYGTLLHVNPSRALVRYQIEQEVVINTKDGETRSFRRTSEDVSIAAGTIVVPLTKLPTPKE